STGRYCAPAYDMARVCTICTHRHRDGMDKLLLRGEQLKSVARRYSAILNRLRQDGDIEEAVSPNFLSRNWPPAFKEWSTKSVRDAFFASPQFPRLLNSESLKETTLWSRFSVPKAEQLWYYGALVEALKQTTAPSALVNELERVV